jgi:TonB family protein
MNVAILQHQLSEVDDRTRKAVVASLIVHLVLIACLGIFKPLSSDDLGLVEVTWLEASALEPATPAPAATLALPEAKQPTPPQPREQKKFERVEEVAEVVPRPQSPNAMDDRLSEKLAALQKAPVSPRPNALPVDAPVSTWASKSVAEATTKVAARPSNLVREASRPATRPSELRRDSTPRPTRLSNVAPNPTSLLNPKAADIDESRVRSLKGAKLAGAVADRPLLDHRMPVYPEWAKADAIEASVTLRFRVLPDGRVKESVIVEKTSGYGDFDKSAIAALLTWRFEPMPAGSTEEQWGKITFDFRLRNRR